MNRGVSEDISEQRGASQEQIWGRVFQMEGTGGNKQGGQGSWSKVSKGSVVRGEDHLGP